jgi:hypothetical protein
MPMVVLDEQGCFSREGAHILKKGSTRLALLDLSLTFATEDAPITLHLDINRVTLPTSVASAV